MSAPAAAGADAAIAVAGLSVRAMAESLARGGLPVVALDVFGDADTRAASVEWAAIGTAEGLAIDPARFVAALGGAARRRPLRGWIAGSGFEAAPAALATWAGVPLLGNAADVVGAVRQPRGFFAALAGLGLHHPPVRFAPPGPDEDDGAWLRKSAASAGGWGVRPWHRAASPSGRATTRAAAAAAAKQGAADGLHYWQRRQAGTPVSALFLADGRSARVVGLNEQLVQAVATPRGVWPYAFAGALAGLPADAPPALASALAAACERLAAHFGLRGLCSLDALCVAGAQPVLQVLEVNPRPSATLVLHDAAVEGALMRAHIDACAGRLPPLRHEPLHAAPSAGFAIVYAPRAARFGTRALQASAAAPWCHDRPAAPGTLQPGQPVCSVAAAGGTRAAIAATLVQRSAEVLQWLEPLEPFSAAEPLAPSRPASTDPFASTGAPS